MENSKAEQDWATLADTPMVTAPAGLVSNLIDPESRAWHVEFTIGLTLAPAILLVVLRIYARLRLARSLGIDDYVCLLATATTLVFNGLVLSFLDKPGGGALGPHIWNVSRLRVLQYQWPATIESLFLRLSNTLIKVSILTFFLRIFNPVPRLRLMIWIGLVAVVAFFIVILAATLMLCPNSQELGISERCTRDLPRYSTAGTIFSVITDFYILLIPMQLLPSLKLSQKRKAAVGGVFLIGLFVCFAGITNLVIRFVRYLPTDLDDFTWNIIDTYITKIAETNIGLICACLPVASPIIVGPVRRFYALFSSCFRKQEEEIPGSRGYRDLPVTASASSQSRRAPTIPRATITGLGTLIRKISGSKDAHEESTMMDTLPTIHANPGSSKSPAVGNRMITRSYSSMDPILVMPPPSR
ncbi:hypothetical protein F5Y14DRAFT_329118 [Nemania sp. NC0429]|nr:hypothetical protein F5Y14DRAFT_329118 [Nemania sp. NC0429]